MIQSHFLWNSFWFCSFSCEAVYDIVSFSCETVWYSPIFSWNSLWFRSFSCKVVYEIISFSCETVYEFAPFHVKQFMIYIIHFSCETVYYNYSPLFAWNSLRHSPIFPWNRLWFNPFSRETVYCYIVCKVVLWKNLFGIIELTQLNRPIHVRSSFKRWPGLA